MEKETTDNVRIMSGRKNIKNIKDDGETMTASVEVAEGIWRDDVEIIQPYGLSASVPEDGAMGIVLPLGGDEGDMVILPVANPSVRLGGLKEGEVGLYNKDGDQLIITPEGEFNMQSGTHLNVDSPKSTLNSPEVNLGEGGKTPASGINHLVHVTFGSSAGMHPIATGSPSVNLEE